MTITDTDALKERIAAALWNRALDNNERIIPDCHVLADAILPIVDEERRKGKAEAFDSFCNALADHLDLATPRAWDFHHPCDPPGVRWEPTERDKALMDVADMIRNDTLNPYTEAGGNDDHR